MQYQAEHMANNVSVFILFFSEITYTVWELFVCDVLYKSVYFSCLKRCKLHRA